MEQKILNNYNINYKSMFKNLMTNTIQQSKPNQTTNNPMTIYIPNTPPTLTNYNNNTSRNFFCSSMLKRIDSNNLRRCSACSGAR